ncbi:MAG: hypothetical protein AAF609_12800 [Cyanobacteria bacterium P01_C01_bin.120]
MAEDNAYKFGDGLPLKLGAASIRGLKQCKRPVDGLNPWPKLVNFKV